MTNPLIVSGVNLLLAQAAAPASSSSGLYAALKILVIIACILAYRLWRRAKSKLPRFTFERTSAPSYLYLWRNRKAEGPFQIAAIQKLYKEGQISTQTFAREKKGEGWKFLSNFYQPENYHIPYCQNCQDYVRPQVVSHNTQTSSPRIAVPVGDYGYVVSPGGTSSTHFTKFCSICGGHVYSQADLDSTAATSVKAPNPRFESEKEENNRKRIIEACIVVPILLLFIIICYMMYSPMRH